MMKKPDLGEENHAKDGISAEDDVKNKERKAAKLVEDGSGTNKRESDQEEKNYETSPESAAFYEEILNKDELHNLKAEFNRLKNSCYLDHAGATLYATSQLESYFSELQSNLYSNPHSRNPSSTITTDSIDFIRQRILAHFGTSLEDYTVIFTSGTTAALKLVAESFDFNGGIFAYLEESHTSVVGMRELVTKNPDVEASSENASGASKVICLSKSALTKLMDPDFHCGEDVHHNCLYNSRQKQWPDMEKTSCCSIHQQYNEQDAHHAQKQKKDLDSPLSAYPSKSACQDSMHTLLMQANPPDSSKHGGEVGLEKLEKSPGDTSTSTRRNCLIAYPAQCNFSGFKYPLEWIPHLQNGRLDYISQSNSFYIQEAEKIINLDTPSSTKTRNAYQSSLDTGKPINCVNNIVDDVDGLLVPTEKDDFYVTAKDKRENDQNRDCDPHQRNRRTRTFVLLDAASFVATNALDLSKHPADFVTMSFYKMFGFPTGLGALIVRNESAHVLKKRYFGGGTVNIQVPSQMFHVKRANLYERFEDGTIPFLSILAVKDGLDTLSRLCRSMDYIRERTFRLAQYFYRALSSMTYGNGQRVAKIYSDTEFTSSQTQGPVVTFNLLRSDGAIIGYSEMEQIAYLHEVHLRYGCFCNPGACRRHLNLEADEVIKQYEAGHVCGDLNDLIDGKPTGAIRLSIGYMTTRENLDFLLQLIYRCWILPQNFRERNENSGVAMAIVPPVPQVSRPDILSVESTVGKRSNERNSFKEEKLLRIFVYPIKSCAPFEVPKTWAIGPRGLLYDREWLIVNSAGVPLTQKREPRLCQLQPKIDISNRKLVLSIQGLPDMSTPLEISQLERGKNNNLKTEMCSSKVCGDIVMGLDCGDEVNNWLSEALGRDGVKLIRMSADHQRKPKKALDNISLANHSQFLLLSMGSLRRLAQELIEKRVVSYLIPTWEEEALVEDHISKVGNHCVQNPSMKMEQKVVNNLIERLRGNFVIGTADLDGNDTAFDEEEWDGVRIGDMMFKSGGPCTRCATICTDQKTGDRGPEPLLTLSAMRNGRANFGIHLYCAGVADKSCCKSSSNTTTISSLLSSSSSSSVSFVNAHESISPSFEGKVHFQTIKPGSTTTINGTNGGGTGTNSSSIEDEPLQENGMKTVPSGRYSVKNNKTPLERPHLVEDGAYTVPITKTTETFLQRKVTMMEKDHATITTSSSISAGTTTKAPVQNLGINLKNQQSSSNSSSESSTFSSMGSLKLANSWISMASQVQAIHIGDIVTAQKSHGPGEISTSGEDEIQETLATSSLSSSSSSSSSHLHVAQREIQNSKNSLSSYPSNIGAGVEASGSSVVVGKSNSTFSPTGDVQSKPFAEPLKLSATRPSHDETKNAKKFSDMKCLIESID